MDEQISQLRAERMDIHTPLVGFMPAPSTYHKCHLVGVNLDQAVLAHAVYPSLPEKERESINTMHNNNNMVPEWSHMVAHLYGKVGPLSRKSLIV